MLIKKYYSRNGITTLRLLLLMKDDNKKMIMMMMIDGDNENNCVLFTLERKEGILHGFFIITSIEF